jgi:hypothetical protein
MKSNKIYLVKYYGGSYDDNYTVNIFATSSKSKATKYRAKFNRILKKWKAYYSQYETNKLGFNWIDDSYVDNYYNRWSFLSRINMCYYEEVEVR